MSSTMVGRGKNSVTELPAILGVTATLAAILDTTYIVRRCNTLLRPIQTECTWTVRPFWRGSWSILSLRRQA